MCSKHSNSLLDVLLSPGQSMSWPETHSSCPSRRVICDVDAFQHNARLKGACGWPAVSPKLHSACMPPQPGGLRWAAAATGGLLHRTRSRVGRALLQGHSHWHLHLRVCRRDRDRCRSGMILRAPVCRSMSLHIICSCVTVIHQSRSNSWCDVDILGNLLTDDSFCFAS